MPDLTKDVRVTLDGENPEIMTLPRSAVAETTLKFRAPVLASTITLEMLSFHTKRENGYNKIRVWKKGLEQWQHFSLAPTYH